MSSGRSWQKGAMPEYLFVVTNGKQYRVYEKIGPARATRTLMNNPKNGGSYKVMSVHASEAEWGEEL